MTFESARTDDETTDATQTTSEPTPTSELPDELNLSPTSAEIAAPVASAAEDAAQTPVEPEVPDEPVEPVASAEAVEPSEQAGPQESEQLPSSDVAPTADGTPAPDRLPTADGEPTLPEEAPGEGETVAAAPESAVAQASAEESAASGEPVAPAKPLDLDTISLRTTTLEKDLETAEHKVSLVTRLTALQDALNNFDASEIRAELDARLAAVQSAIAAQAQERIGLKEAIIAKAEELRESQEWKATSEAFRTMQEELRGIGAAGKELDDPIWERFRQARSAFHERRTAFFAEREKQWEESKAKKEALAAEAEALADVDDFRDKSSRARAMMDEWKAAGFAGRQAEDALWPQFRGALDRFYERRGAYYEQNREHKERLAAQAEEIADSTDWRTTAEALRRLMAEWKTLGSAGREHDDPLWERFRGAQQRFYDARSAVFAERETAHKENIARKEELCEQAEEIAGRSDMRGAIQDVIALQAAWKQVGFIPREKSDELWHRFKAACDAVFTHVDAERQDREQSREQGFKDAVSRKREQYQRLNESIAHDQANINRWRDTISSLGGGGRADQIRNELENRVIEVLMRVRDKQARAEELSNDLQDMEARQQG